MDVQMKYSVLKPSNPISIIAFLHNFQTACDSNGLHERAEIGLFPHFVEKQAKAALSYRMSTTESNTIDKEGILTTHWQVFNYVLEAYTTDDVIAEAESDIMNYKQPKNMSAVCYSETLW